MRHQLTSIVDVHKVDAALYYVGYERLSLFSGDTRLSGLAAQQLHPQLPRIAQDSEHGLLNHKLAVVDDGNW
jgi:hypothetical protein